jgi:D-serine deaminase-like pyridoxal phosphate-dependent protein
MERPVQKPPGTPVLELDTPALVLDIGVFEANLAKDGPVAPVWVDGSVHRCPAIAHRQIAAGARGIFVWSLSEAELMAQQGFSDIAIGTPLVTKQKKVRAAALARQTRLTLDADRSEVSELFGLDGGPAIRVLATVISRPEPGLAILDMGQKAVSADLGQPAVHGMPGARISKMSAEHGFLVSEGPLPEIGEKVWAIPGNLGSCMNLYDFVNVVRDGRLEAVWPVAGRGLYH